MRGIGALAVAFGLLVSTAGPAAAQIELRNDDFTDMEAVTFHAGFVTGEIGASRFIPVGNPPYYVTAIRFLFGGVATQQTITLRIYDDSGLQTNPGAQLFTGDYDVTGSDNAFYEVDLTLDNVQVSGPFRVGIEVQHNGAPSIANDTGGVDYPDRNFLYASNATWYAANAPPINIAGDWIIRADILNSGGTPDAGPTPTPDAGVPAVDAAPSPDAAGGQFCMVHSECPTGQYCTDGNECTYDCRIDTDCGNDMRCTSLGMCEETGGGGGCDTGGGTSGLAWALLCVLGLVAARRRSQPR